ncbi:uncharacterized protein VP01_218g5 [Puccinia sorghi]|uniref:Uncharacterized protein n=1 Tax=Puccinia sorghi TaxID=27349 RepID=A0A0L6V9R7_9BASI|nr:uncharacterized protein VP01_218g5 [Puccinia sorghi]
MAAEPNRVAAEENFIATPRFNPQEIQQVIQLFQLGSNTPSYQNADASTVTVLSAGGRVPREMSSTARQNGENDLLSLETPEQRENAQSWGADQGTASSSTSLPQHRLRAEHNTLADWPRSTEPLLNQPPRLQYSFVGSGNRGSSFEDSEHIPQLFKMKKPHKPETLTAIENHPSPIEGIKNYGRLKFNTDLFKGEGPHQSERNNILRLLNSIPRPSQGNFLFTEDELVMVCGDLNRKMTNISKPSMTQIEILMSNIDIWYQYWNKHAKIDLASLYCVGKLLRYQFVFPLFLLYVEMILSIIPFKKGLPLDVELDYPHEMRDALKSYQEFHKILQTPPDDGVYKIWIEKRRSFQEHLGHARKCHNKLLWTFVDFWLESKYKSVWNHVKAKHAYKNFQSLFNTIFTQGIQTLNEKLQDYLPHK